MQDGEAAGMSVYHVHIHVMPRRPGDFPVNDDVYREIEHDNRKARSEEEMAAEAARLRLLFEPENRFHD